MDEPNETQSEMQFIGGRSAHGAARRHELRHMDADLRARAGNCSTCGKPRAGLAFEGQTREQAGICDCPGQEASDA